MACNFKFFFERNTWLDYLNETLINEYGSFQLLQTFGNQFFDNIIYLLEKYWVTNEDKVILYEALMHVLEETEKGKIDFNAEIIYDNKYKFHQLFKNQQYEKNWNGIRKFFFRLERRIPGATEFVRLKIKLYLKHKKVSTGRTQPVTF